MKFFDPFADIRRTANSLPHWQQPGATYFITFRLADSIPAELLAQWREERAAWLRFHPEPWSVEVEREYHERFRSRVEDCLDDGHGNCVLRDGENRALAGAALTHFDGVQWRMLTFVIMPNHVHTVVALHADSMLERVIGGWKSVSSRGIGRRLGRRGMLWQEDYFDRLIRDEKHLRNCIRYIRRNPAKARLRSDEYTLYESDLAKGY